MSLPHKFKVGDRVICSGLYHGTISDCVNGWFRIKFDGPELGPRVANYWGEWEIRSESNAVK